MYVLSPTVQEGHNNMLVGTVDWNQQFHIVAYAICSHEDVRAHEAVFSRVRVAVNEVVARRAANSERV